MTIQSTAAVGSREDILARAAAVPPLTGFPTVDELKRMFARIEAEHPSLVSSRRIGTSRLGDPIRVYTIGSGTRRNLIVGGVHPNEPIGSWTSLHLARALVDDEELRIGLDASWHIVPTIDPDGMRLNEGWFDNPGDRAYYARRFYRPPGHEQVEWTFPTDYKGAYFDRMLPETVALMRLIDDVRPTMYAALHNGEMGGVYYYLSQTDETLTGLLHAIPHSLGLPLATGEPESPHLRELAPAIYSLGPVSEAYDYLESIGVDPATRTDGSSSTQYAARHHALCLVAELPYWSHPDAEDQTETEESYAALLRRAGSELRDAMTTLAEVLAEAEPFLRIDTPFLRASRSFIPDLLRTADTDVRRSELPAAARPATVAERFSIEDTVHCFKLRYGGMLVRALELEVAAGLAPVALHPIAGRLKTVYESWLAEPNAGQDAQEIPVSKLVGVQYGAVLATAAAARSGAAAA